MKRLVLLYPPLYTPLPQNLLPPKLFIGPMFDVEPALIPHHEVKYTFIKSHRLAFCVGMALRGISVLQFAQHYVLLNSS